MYYQMLRGHGDYANVPSKDFIELLEYKLECLKSAQEKDSSWNYNIEELESEINQLKGFVNMMN